PRWRRRLCGGLVHQEARPGVVLRARRRQLGIQLHDHRAQAQRLWTGGDDEFRQRPAVDRGNQGTSRKSLWLGFAEQARATLKFENNGPVFRKESPLIQRRDDPPPSGISSFL